MDGGNGAGQGVNVGEANIGEANIGEANVGMAGDLEHPAAPPGGPARDNGVAPLLPAEGSGVQDTRPDDPPAQPKDSVGADVTQTETKEGKTPEAGEKP